MLTGTMKPKHTQLLDYIRVTTTNLKRVGIVLPESCDFGFYETTLRAAFEKYLRIPHEMYLGQSAGFYGYACCLDMCTGVKVLCLARREIMGICLQISGQGLESLRVLGWNDIELAKLFFIDEWRCSRIDYAIDTRDGYIVSDLLCARRLLGWRPKHSATQISLEDENTNYQTMNINKREAPRFVRCYEKEDKGLIQQKYARLEMEYKDDKAKWALAAFNAIGYAALAYDLIDFMRNPPISGFPTVKDIKCLKWIPTLQKPPIKNSVAWVQRCKRAIWVGIKLMGVDAFKEMMNNLGDSPLFD